LRLSVRVKAGPIIDAVGLQGWRLSFRLNAPMAGTRHLCDDLIKTTSV
jgi:hypothetical protein